MSLFDWRAALALATTKEPAPPPSEDDDEAGPRLRVVPPRPAGRERRRPS